MFFDVIVVGVGTMGAATTYELAKKGVKVLGIEQYSIVNQNSSHYGQSRLIRKAYYEHPDYVPLLEHAYKGWNELENEAGVQLYHETGILYMGDPSHELLNGTKRSAEKYDITLNNLETEDFSEHYPVFDVPGEFECFVEKHAGFLSPEKAIETFCRLAKAAGAEIKENERVISWKQEKKGLTVVTTENTYQCEKIIFTSGAFTKQLLPQLKPSLKVTRQIITWVKPKDREPLMVNHFPCWTVAEKGDDGFFYGFPIVAGDGELSGLKVGHHLPGEEIDPQDMHTFDSHEEEEKLKTFMNRFMPGVFESFSEIKSCLYTYSEDGHFLVDFLPDSNKNVIIAAGFSGHGFKFAPVIGRALADLSEKGETRLPVDFLSFGRDFGLSF